ncbi:MAG TPA: putative metal-binding motif-containing protein, partial [Myxococcota bacterium]|nr:putative metal-binding motif-containing protein [Myxococcota bacterium]
MAPAVVSPLLFLLILGCSAGKDLDADQDGYAAGDDCDDANAAVYPQASERCDGIDNNCDGEIDGASAEDQVPLYADTDADGYGDAAASTVACPGQPGWVDDATDCNDGDAGIFPGAGERCNGVDDNCDGTVDEATATDATEWFLDDDGDAFGDPSQGLTACEAPPGYEAASGDCDDQDREVHPGAPERCDSRDNNCDGQTDESAAIDAASWYPDGDGDGFGADTGAVVACEAPPGFSAADADCDDADPAIFPGAAELCNGLDDDCDGAIDPASSGDARTWYADGDGDGFGDASTTALSCDQPPSYTGDSSDCDDFAVTSFPGADEWCNGADDNCDGQVDEDSALDTSVWYADADADGFGDAQSSRPACTAPSGWVADTTDCDDGLSTVFPGADEWCNGLDDNCDGQVDEDSALDATVWYTDADADGVGDATSGSPHCEAPAGSTALGTDCDDADASAYPGAPEACDGVDHNCDGVTATGSSVPTDYATISLAIAAATDGDTICVEAGSYAEALDFGGKTLQLVGAGSAFTFLDVSSGPIRSAAGSLSGLTIHSGIGAAGSGSGGGLICAGSTLSLDDLLFSDHQCSETYCYGTVISATECDLSWNKV